MQAKDREIALLRQQLAETREKLRQEVITIDSCTECH